MVVPVLATLIAVPPPSSADAHRPEGPGPAMLSAASLRTASLTCHGDLEQAPRAPVLLVPGTAMSAEENWGSTYLPVLLDRGHAVCLVELPDFATRDVQASSEYVATAIRLMARGSSRRIATIGHSQGAFLPLVALRTWPDLSVHVADVIGLAGVYDRGSSRLTARCANRCTPVMHQLAARSAFLRSIRRVPLPAGPSYTNVGTVGDETVTPQPVANHQRGARSIMLEGACPGRATPPLAHAMIVGDAVALGLVIDALGHPGPASASRLDPYLCEQGEYPGFDSARFIAAASNVSARTARGTRAEPPLYCRRRPSCRDPNLRGLLTARIRYDVRRRTVTVRTEAQVPGRLRISLGGRVIQRAVRPGPVTVQIRRPARRARLVVASRPRHYTVWATEGGRWLNDRSPAAV